MDSLASSAYRAAMYLPSLTFLGAAAGLGAATAALGAAAAALGAVTAALTALRALPTAAALSGAWAAALRGAWAAALRSAWAGALRGALALAVFLAAWAFAIQKGERGTVICNQ